LPLAQRTVREGTATIVDDVETHSDATERSRRVARARGFRSFVWMPMVHGGATVGWISVTRTEPGPFSDNELVLLKTFADQAVIAIENVRLFTELEARNRDLTEALQQQTATAEILRVIASSPTDIQPVLNAVAQNAARVCGADDALIYRVDGDVYQRVAHHGPIAETAAFERRLSRDSMSGRATVDRRTIHVPDIEAAPGDELPETRRLARLVGARTHLAAPLIREGAAIGAILIRCLEVRPFAPKQISLLETFADQAVIAIENVRLFNETKEALEQQTSTAEILRVIASSPTDLQSVLDAVAESAARLCEASDVLIHRVDGQMLPIVASVGSFAATYSADERFPINRGSVVGRAVMERKTIHIHDLAAESAEEFPIAKEFQRRHGHRTVLTTPLMREGMPLGAIWMRRTEVRPFTDKQIKLLETFADQAVIAIENARLFTELQEKNQAVTLAHAQVSESLEQQTATAEILSVISGSPTDIRPVFDAVLNRALTLCEASNGSLYQLEDGALRHVGVLGIGAITAVGGVLSLESAPGWAVLEKRTVHIEDVLRSSIGWLQRLRPKYGVLASEQSWPCHCCASRRPSERSSFGDSRCAHSQRGRFDCSRPSPTRP
jgi:GAF domain-containing protein